MKRLPASTRRAQGRPDPEPGEFTRVEGPKGFEALEEADQAGRFLEARQAGRRGAEGFPELGELGE